MFKIYTFLSGTRDAHLVYDARQFPMTSIVTSASYSLDTSNAGTFDFTIPYNHPLYNEFQIKESMIYIIRDETTVVWYGRVYSISRDFNLNKKISCEGALSFLSDICVIPFKYYAQKSLYTIDHEPKDKDYGHPNGLYICVVDNKIKSYYRCLGESTKPGKYNWETLSENTVKVINISSSVGYMVTEKTKLDHLNELMLYYNTRKPKLKMDIRLEVDHDAETSQRFTADPIVEGEDSYRSVLEAINSTIIEDYTMFWVPYFAINENEDEPLITVQYTLTTFPQSTSNQTIEVGVNMLDITEDMDSDGMYDSVIPVGKNGLSLFHSGDDQDPPNIPLHERTGFYVGAGNYDKVLQVDQITTRDDLYALAELNIRTGGGTILPVLTISAVDLHWLNTDINQFYIGQTCRIKYDAQNIHIDETYMCTHIDYDMLDPSSSSVTFTNQYYSRERNFTDKVNKSIIDLRNALNQKLDKFKPEGKIWVNRDGFSILIKDDNT